jgi:transposase
MDFKVPHFMIPLDIPNVEILKVEQNKVNDFILTIASTCTSTSCSKCNKQISKIHGYSDTIILRHLPILEKRVYLVIKLTRYKCYSCPGDPTTTEQPEWFDRGSRFTKAYDKHLMRALISSTIQDVSKKEYVTYDEVVGSLNRQVSMHVNWDDFKELSTVGVDEISLKKGHKDYVTVVTTRINNENRIVAVLPGRTKAEVKNFFLSIPKHLQLTVKSVCADMYIGFINAAIEVFGDKVKIIVDRYHVSTKYRGAVDDLRKQEFKKLKSDLPEEEYKNLRGAMWALRKKDEKRSDDEKEIVKEVFKYSPILEQAYELENKLTDIFNDDLNKTQAIKKINLWIKEVDSSNVRCFDFFISVTLKNNWSWILNYFHRKCRQNSGFVEGLNNKIKVIKRRCYGIFNIGHLFQRIFLDIEGYAIY